MANVMLLDHKIFQNTRECCWQNFFAVNFRTPFYLIASKVETFFTFKFHLEGIHRNSELLL